MEDWIFAEVGVAQRSLNELNKNLDSLNKNLSVFNDASKKMQFWLIAWTAVIAIATILSLFV